ncbi:MAG: alpha/beta hydrolase [Bifidobacteriaceae bacterium]|jgi:pimeloyl-ACP methyl ester carboxylesterase|nr:alpha/beta hydrolase [Bifidobacteriaceae bacterium]
MKSLIKAGFVGGGYLTPHLAAKAGAKLWCRLPRNQSRRKDNRPHPGTVERVAIDGTRHLTVEWWGASDAPLVYVVHGWGGWRGQVASFVTPLVESGLRALTFDCLSHGDSDPGEHGSGYSSGGEMIRSLKAVAAVYGPARGVIAHSLGCGATARSILESALSAERLAFIAPNPDMGAIATDFGHSLGFPPRTIRLMIHAMERWAHRTVADFDVAAMGETGSLPPALIVHDRADKEVPFATATDIEARWPGSHLVPTDGYGHHRILIAPEVIRAAAEWMV